MQVMNFIMQSNAVLRYRMQWTAHRVDVNVHQTPQYMQSSDCASWLPPSPRFAGHFRPNSTVHHKCYTNLRWDPVGPSASMSPEPVQAFKNTTFIIKCHNADVKLKYDPLSKMNFTNLTMQ